MSLKKVIECIRRNNNFVITAHTNLEGDALGSELAFYFLLKALGKRAIIINDDSLPYGYDFLPGVNKIIKYKDNLKGIKFDCFVLLDCSGMKRCGEVYRLNRENKPVLNIDHHISNDNFGDVNWVEPHTSSCCEMIYKIYKKIPVPITKASALCLYTGILTDTGSFRYSNTSSFVHKAVAELIGYGLNPAEIYNNIYARVPYQDMKLLASILPKMNLCANAKVVWFTVTRRALKNRKLSFDLSESILNFGRSIKDVEVVALFKENMGLKNEIRINFRSQGKVDVNKIASYFGGGGHRTASACTMRASLSEARRRVLKKIEEVIANKRHWQIFSPHNKSVKVLAK